MNVEACASSNDVATLSHRAWRSGFAAMRQTRPASAHFPRATGDSPRPEAAGPARYPICVRACLAMALVGCVCTTQLKATGSARPIRTLRVERPSPPRVLPRGRNARSHCDPCGGARAHPPCDEPSQCSDAAGERLGNASHDKCYADPVVRQAVRGGAISAHRHACLGPYARARRLAHGLGAS